MNLQEFLKEVDGVESNIINYKGDEALAAVKQDGYALKFVTEQTPEICMAAVKQNGYALKYVDKSIFEDIEDYVIVNGIKYIKA
jgi:hypothetical protein